MTPRSSLDDDEAIHSVMGGWLPREHPEWMSDGTQRNRAFLICPVRGVPKEATAKIAADIEARGWELHWPPRDTNQEDSIGLRICTDNLIAIGNAEAVFFAWDGKSQGCLFDLGMAFALGKRVVPVREMMPEVVGGQKSFQAMVWEAYRQEAVEAIALLADDDHEEEADR